MNKTTFVAAHLCMVIAGTFLSMHAYARQDAPVRFDAFDGGRIGAKAQGMGFAFTAAADTADAPYWNPAGLAYLPGNLFTISLDAVRQSRLSTAEIIGGEPLRGRTVTFLSFAGQNGALGFRPLSDINDRIVLDPAAPETNYEQRQIKVNSFFLSAASSYNENMTIGITINYLNGRLAHVIQKEKEDPYVMLDDGNGYTIDVSMLYHPDKMFQIGITGQNVPGQIFWGDYNKTNLPAMLRAGTVLRLPSLMSIAYEYEKRFYRGGVNRPQINHIGIEQQVNPYLCLRGGIYGEDLKDKERVHYTAGLGYTRKGYFVDLAMDTYERKDDITDTFENIYNYLVSISIPFASLEPTSRK